MSTTHSNTSSNSHNRSSFTSVTSFAAKLRRLKIEESIILQSLNKGACMGQVDDEIVATNKNNLSYVEFKKFLVQTKNSFNELKQLFEDIKASTSSKEVIKYIDIDEIKKSTLELERNIKSLKTYLHTEINALKSAEQQLNQKLNDTNLISHLRRKPRTQTAKYTEIVPSPVKSLMTSPFKCIEVQEFQEFMKNSKNRYGGWDEYHHNIFINIWQKHFGAESPIPDVSKDSDVFNIFLRELVPKLLGYAYVSEEDVIAHVKWYTKYVELKDSQQKAIDKWRFNRRMMKSSNGRIESETDGHIKAACSKKKTRVNPDNVNNIVSDYLNHKEEHILDKDNGKRRSVRACLSDNLLENSMNNNDGDLMENYEQPNLRYLKATKQWNIRCFGEDVLNQPKPNTNDIENIKKLRIPMWRSGL